jgi:hypothetical protein
MTAKNGPLNRMSGFQTFTVVRYSEHEKVWFELSNFQMVLNKMAACTIHKEYKILWKADTIVLKLKVFQVRLITIQNLDYFVRYSGHGGHSKTGSHFLPDLKVSFICRSGNWTFAVFRCSLCMYWQNYWLVWCWKATKRSGKRASGN